MHFSSIKNFEKLNISNESLKIKDDNNQNRVYRFYLESINDYKVSIFSERDF